MVGIRVVLRLAKIACHAGVYLLLAFFLLRFGRGFMDGVFGG